MKGVHARTLLALTGLVALALLVSQACGGGDDDGGAYAGGPIVCERLASDEYKYKVRVVFDIDHSLATYSPDVQGGPPTGRLEQNIEGQINGQEASSATIDNADRGNHTIFGAVVIGDRKWLQTPAGWREQPAESRGYDPIPYRPVNLCQALAPDFDTTNLQATTEDVNGIESQRFDLTGFTTDFPDRTPDFGGGSDVANLIPAFDGSVWVAKEGGFVSRMEFSGTGQYPDGTRLTLEVSYEISGMGEDVEIQPPV